MNLFWRLWEKVSFAGVDPSFEPRLKRRVILTNQLSFTVTIVVFVAWNVMDFAFQLPDEIRVTYIIACLGYGATILFNKLNWINFSRIWLNLLPPLMIAFFSAILSDGQVVAMKLALMSVIIVPMLLFGIDEPFKMAFGVLWVVVVFIGSDFTNPLLPNWIGMNPALIDSAVSITINGVMSIVLFLFAFSYFQKLTNDAETQLANEKERSEQLLLNILPEEIATLLKRDSGTIANYYEEASVLFADIVNFTPLSAQMNAQELVKLLNEVFSYFDALVDKYDLEKIKTIGDCYMVAAGVPRGRKDHAEVLTKMALEARTYFAEHTFQGKKITFRMGINSGPLIAGVIGRKKFIYDLWGDAVNIASRMETQGAEGRIQITNTTYELLKDRFTCEPHGVVNVKGKGDMQVWAVIGSS